MKNFLDRLLKTCFIFLWRSYHKTKYKIKVLWHRFQIKLNKNKFIATLSRKQKQLDDSKNKVAEMLKSRASGIKTEYSSINEIPFIKKAPSGEVVWLNRQARRKLKIKK